MTDTVRLLEAMQRELRRLREEREKQCAWYVQAATILLGPTVVRICDIEPWWDGSPLRGMIDRVDGAYRIRIAPDLPLAVERSVFTHEVSHGLLGHAAEATSENARKAEVARNVLFSPELAKACPHVDTKGLFWKAHFEREAEANRLAATLHGLVFPGERYELQLHY